MSDSEVESISSGISSSDKVLMDAIREFRALYDKSTKDFKNKRAKENAWKELSGRLKIPAEELQKRYRNIRTVFGRYIRSLKPPSGSGRDAVILKPAYEHLRWLMTHIEHRATTSNYGETASNVPVELGNPPSEVEGEDSDGELDAAEDSDSVVISTPLPPPPPPSKRPYSKTNVSMKANKHSKAEFEAQLLASINNLGDETDDISIFCKSIALKISKLTPYQQAIVQSQIYQCVLNAQLGIIPKVASPAAVQGNAIAPPTNVQVPLPQQQSYMQQPCYNQNQTIQHMPDHLLQQQLHTTTSDGSTYRNLN